MRRYAVIGRPARHSLSPWLHARFAQKTQRDIVYAAIETDDFAAAAAAFFAAGGSGLNITVPYKAEALAFASSATAFARQCGSANVLLKQPGGALRACNTDGAGLIGDLQFYCARLGISLSEQTILLLGAGGAARAAAFALAKTRSKRRPKPLHIYNRTPARARALADAINSAAQTDSAKNAKSTGAAAVIAQAANTLDCRADIIIHATSAGHGAALNLPSSLFAGCALAYDLSYGAAAKPFLQQATQAKCAADGLGMLARQAALSFCLWEAVLPSFKDEIRLLRRC